MAKICSNCGKIPSVGHKISHSNIKTLRRFEPNLMSKRVVDPKTGKLVRRRLCTGCLRTLVKVKRIRNARVKK